MQTQLWNPMITGISRIGGEIFIKKLLETQTHRWVERRMHFDILKITVLLTDFKANDL